jgi:hypothetical protein
MHFTMEQEKELATQQFNKAMLGLERAYDLGNARQDRREKITIAVVGLLFIACFGLLVWVK